MAGAGAVRVPAGDHLISLRHHPFLVLELFAFSVLLTLWRAVMTARGALERRRPRKSVAPPASDP